MAQDEANQKYYRPKARNKASAEKSGSQITKLSACFVKGNCGGIRITNTFTKNVVANKVMNHPVWKA